MPFTPFHFGPGLALYAAAPRHVNLAGYCAVNVVIDLEPLYAIVTHNPPLHRELHTFPGALLASGVTWLGMVAAGRLTARRGWPNWLDWQGRDRLALAVGILLGGLSHVVLDGFLYTDVHPFAPWSPANPFLGLASLSGVYLFCVLAGLVGMAVLGLRLLRR